jgi:predicted nucleic acid-binding protein
MEKLQTITFYLDSNIIIGYYIDYNKHPQVKEVFQNQIENVQFLTSRWTLTEIIKVLIKEYKWTKDQTYKFIYKISTQRRIGKNEFKLIKVSPNNEYDFDDFFLEIDNELLEIKSSLGDSIHARIMRNNEINHILTLNKKDFQQFSRFIVLEPNELVVFLKNQQDNTKSEETENIVGEIEQTKENIKDTLIIEQISDNDEDFKKLSYNVKIDNNQVEKGQEITSTVEFIGEIENGFFDHYITDIDGKKIGWNWDRKTLINGKSTTPGTLSGKIRVKSSWKLNTTNFKTGKYIINPRVYEHDIKTHKRKILITSEPIEFEVK